MQKRPKRPGRLAWFRFEVDVFHDDPRTRPLTNREKAGWILMLVNSFHSAGFMSTDPDIVAEQTGSTPKEAKRLVLKLLEEQLLVPTGKPFEAYSPRMFREHEHATTAYARFADLGKAGGEKRAALALVKK